MSAYGTKANTYKEKDHSLGIHALSHVKLEIFEIRDNLLRKVLSTLFKLCYAVWVRCLKMGLDSLHVSLEVREVGLRSVQGRISRVLSRGDERTDFFVESGRLKTERVHDVVDLGCTGFESFLGLLGGRITT